MKIGDLKQIVKQVIKEDYDDSYRETLEYRVAKAISNATEAIFIEEGYDGWGVAANANNVAEYMIKLLEEDKEKYGSPEGE